MHELALIAATEWARTNSHAGVDPVKFGHRVALAYCACWDTRRHAGNEAATAASLAALSIRPEVLQAIAQLAELTPAYSTGMTQTDSAGTES